MIARALAPLLFLTFTALSSGCGSSAGGAGGTGGAGGGGAGGGGPSPYQCSGACACEDATAACTCQGGSTCATTCDEPCSLGCDGAQKCDLTCGDGCTMDCRDAGCTAHVGAGAHVTCGSNGICEVFCAGDCTLDCPGSALCLVHCTPGATCTITTCDAPMACPKDVSTCRTGCPPTTG